MRKLIAIIAVVIVITGIITVINREKSCVSDITVSASGYIQADDEQCGSDYSIINYDETGFDLYGSKSQDSIPGDEDQEFIIRLQPGESYPLNGDGYYSYGFSQSGDDTYIILITK